MNKNLSRLGRKTSKHPKEDIHYLTLREQLKAAGDNLNNAKVDEENNEKDENQKPPRSHFQIFEEQKYEEKEGVDQEEKANICSMLKKNFLNFQKSTPKAQYQNAQNTKLNNRNMQTELESPEFLEEKADTANEGLKKSGEEKNVVLIDEDILTSCSDQKNCFNSDHEDISTKPTTCTKEPINFEEMHAEPEIPVDKEFEDLFERNSKPKLPPKGSYDVIEISDDDGESSPSVSAYRQKEAGSNKREMIRPYIDDVVEKKFKANIEKSAFDLVLAKVVCELEEAKKIIKDLKDENTNLKDEMSALKDENSNLKAVFGRKKYK